MLNILAWCDVSHHFRITADTAQTDSIFVHVKDGSIIEFCQLENGLFIHDPSSDQHLRTSAPISPPPSTNIVSKLVSFHSSVKDNNNDDVTPYSMATLVSDIKKNYSRRELQQADLAKDFIKSLGLPSYQQVINLLDKGFFATVLSHLMMFVVR